MKHIFTILIVASVLFLNGCDNKEYQLADWGHTEYYTDFWWKHYEPIKMEKTLVLDFNEDARRFFTGKAVLELMVQKGENLLPTTETMKLYKNNERCDNNRLVLTCADNDINVGVEFLPDAEKGNYKLFLVPVDKGSLDDIVQIRLGDGFYVQKIDIMNPLAKYTMWILIILVGLLLIWIIVSRIINPSLEFSRISFDYMDEVGEIYNRVGSCYKIVCTNKAKKISVFHKIFVGNVFVEVNDFWTEELTIKCGPRSAIRLITRGDYNLPDEAVRKETFTIHNDEQKRKVNIETT